MLCAQSWFFHSFIIAFLHFFSLTRLAPFSFSTSTKNTKANDPFGAFAKDGVRFCQYFVLGVVSLGYSLVFIIDYDADTKFESASYKGFWCPGWEPTP